MRRFLGSLSLRTKMVVAIAALILILGLGGTIHARLTLSGIASDELDQRGLALARDLESRSSELLLMNDIFGLHNRIGELVAANSDVRYVVVLDRAGSVRASTFANGLPEGLRQGNSVAPGALYSLATLETDEGTVRDVAYPIDGGRAGVIRVGLTEEPVQSQVDQLTFNLFGLTGAALLAGLVVSYFLATVLTRPLSRLAEAARAVGRGESPA
jgi:sensor histidine kinase regulating citrate/malate metabolism